MLRLEGPRLAEGADQYQCRFGFTRWPAASLRRSAEAARLAGSRYLGGSLGRMPVYSRLPPSVLSWKFRLQLNMDGKEMQISEQAAHNLAVKVIEALAVSGQIKINGPSTTPGGSDLETQNERGGRDAAYIASLYRNLVSGFRQ